MLQTLPEKEKLSTAQIKVAATGFFSLFSLIGIMFYGLPFFYDFWVRDFGWSRVMVTSGSAFGRITVALLGFGVGWLIDRFGPRRLILAGVIFGGIALMALSTMHTPWQFYLFSLLAALGYICGGFVMILIYILVAGSIPLLHYAAAPDVLADALSPMLVGFLRDRSGSYFTGFAALIGLAVIGIAAVMFLPGKRTDNKFSFRTEKPVNNIQNNNSCRISQIFMKNH